MLNTVTCPECGKIIRLNSHTTTCVIHSEQHEYDFIRVACFRCQTMLRFYPDPTYILELIAEHNCATVYFQFALKSTVDDYQIRRFTKALRYIDTVKDFLQMSEKE